MNKIVFIAGANDYHVAPSLLENFKHQVIPKMGHNFFGFEEEIAQIINNYEENNE